MKIEKIVEEAPKFLSEFYGMPEDTCRERIKTGSKIVREEWEEFCGGEYQDLSLYTEFYKVVKNYPFDLAKFNSVFRLEFTVGIFDAILNNDIPLLIGPSVRQCKPSLLEVGGGGGELSLALSEKFDVWHYDIPSVTFDYAKFRGERYGADITYINKLPNKKFDFVSMMDVFEHLEFPMEVMNNVCDCMKEDALLVSSAYYTSDSHYLHLTPNLAREHMTVAWANQLCLWHTHLIQTEGIQDEEAMSTIGIFRFMETLNHMMEQHKLLLAPQAGVTPMTDEVDKNLIPHMSSMDKINFMMAVG
jgi:2-polyprenyl-3-methyl-5-hydroxy-6-metoxy-1,4-benzoquinol methylase